MRDKVTADAMDVRGLDDITLENGDVEIASINSHMKSDDSSPKVAEWQNAGKGSKAIPSFDVDENDKLPVSFQPAHVLTSKALSNMPNIADHNGSLDDLESKRIFHPMFFLTAHRTEKDLETAGVDKKQSPHLHNGRPDISSIFSKLKELCKKDGISRVAVCTCGPEAMVNEVKDLCRISQMSCEEGAIRFDCHTDIFDF